MSAFDCVCLRSDVPKRQHACCLATQSTSLVVVYVNINMVICRGIICFDFLQINSFNEICLLLVKVLFMLPPISPTIASLLPRCERLMLASHRVIKSM